MRTLIFDTETTGLPPRDDIPVEQYPWMTQLAAILFDDLQPVMQMSCFFNDSRINIPKEQFFLDHGMTNEFVKKNGVTYRFGLQAFEAMACRADQLVAHNISFDWKIILATLGRIDYFLMDEKFHTRTKICTKLTLTPHLKIPNPYGYEGYKWPNLQEAYKAMVKEKGFKGEHDAMNDVYALGAIFFACVEQRVPLVEYHHHG